MHRLFPLSPFPFSSGKNTKMSVHFSATVLAGWGDMNLSLSLYCAVSPASWHFSGRICSWAMPGEKDSGVSLRIWKIGLGRGSIVDHGISGYQ